MTKQRKGGGPREERDRIVITIPIPRRLKSDSARASYVATALGVLEQELTSIGTKVEDFVLLDPSTGETLGSTVCLPNGVLKQWADQQAKLDALNTPDVGPFPPLTETEMEALLEVDDRTMGCPVEGVDPAIAKELLRRGLVKLDRGDGYADFDITSEGRAVLNDAGAYDTPKVIPQTGYKFFVERFAYSRDQTEEKINCIAVRIEDLPNGDVPSGAAVLPAITSVFEHEDSPVSFGKVEAEYLRSQSTAIGEATARKLHPNLFAYLENRVSPREPYWRLRDAGACDRPAKVPTVTPKEGGLK